MRDVEQLRSVTDGSTAVGSLLLAHNAKHSPIVVCGFGTSILRNARLRVQRSWIKMHTQASPSCAHERMINGWGEGRSGRPEFESARSGLIVRPQERGSVFEDGLLQNTL